MTPKEKAMDLVEQFPYSIKEAKDCALIVVDEILDALKGLVFGSEYIYNSAYWEEVKEEIENL